MIILVVVDSIGTLLLAPFGTTLEGVAAARIITVNVTVPVVIVSVIADLGLGVGAARTIGAATVIDADDATVDAALAAVGID